MEVASFAEIEEEFTARVSRIVWCTVATVDRRGRPRTRILHPIWEGSTGWIATGRHSLKEKHLAANPYLSVSYWDQEHQQVYVDAKAEWQDDQAEKLRIWNLYKDAPAPYGYDPAIIWQAGPDDSEYRLLKLTPWRIELYALKDLVTGAEPQIWKP
ncbi:MAG: pyridoxamine 5'-phosphate oxidase family protein [Chloroflexi bacterium]|nr:pyridoxamine 5'-phosphate oxidase family protein [Chloroflexota bacterium]